MMVKQVRLYTDLLHSISQHLHTADSVYIVVRMADFGDAVMRHSMQLPYRNYSHLYSVSNNRDPNVYR